MRFLKLAVFAFLLVLPGLVRAQTIQINRENKTIAISTTDEAAATADIAAITIGFETLGLIPRAHLQRPASSLMPSSTPYTSLASTTRASRVQVKVFRRTPNLKKRKSQISARSNNTSSGNRGRCQLLRNQPRRSFAQQSRLEPISRVLSTGGSRIESRCRPKPPKPLW